MRHLSWVSSSTEILYYLSRQSWSYSCKWHLKPCRSIFYLVCTLISYCSGWRHGNLTKMLQSSSLFPMLYYNARVVFSTQLSFFSYSLPVPLLLKRMKPSFSCCVSWLETNTPLLWCSHLMCPQDFQEFCSVKLVPNIFSYQWVDEQKDYATNVDKNTFVINKKAICLKYFPTSLAEIMISWVFGEEKFFTFNWFKKKFIISWTNAQFYYLN